MSARSYVRNASVVSLAAFGASTVSLAVCVPLLLRILGSHEYGVWVVTGGAVAYLSVFDLGMSTSVSRFAVRSLQRGRRLAQEALTVAVAVLVVVMTTAGVAGVLAIRAWHDVAATPGAGNAAIAAAASLVIVSVTRVWQSTLEGLGEVALSRVLQAIATITFSTGSVVVAASTRNKLEALGEFLVVHSTLSSVVSFAALSRVWSWTLPFARPSRASWRATVSYALSAQLSAVAGALLEPVSRILVGVTGGASAIAPLDIALRTRSQWFGAAVAFTRPMLPALGGPTIRGVTPLARVVRAWRTYVVFFGGASVFMSGLVLFGYPLIFGAAVGHKAGLLSAAIVLLWAPSVLTIAPYYIVTVRGRGRDIALIQGATSIVALAVCAALVRAIALWAPVVGFGAGAIVGASITLFLSRKYVASSHDTTRDRADMRGLMRSMAYAGLALLAVLLPVPRVIAISAAAVVWTALVRREATDLLEAL